MLDMARRKTGQCHVVPGRSLRYLCLCYPCCVSSSFLGTMKFLFPLLALFACAAGFVTPVAKPTLQRGKFHVLHA